MWAVLPLLPATRLQNTKLIYLTMHFKAPPMAMPISTPNLMRKI